MIPLKLFGVGERSETVQSRAVKAAWIGLLIMPSIVATGALACVAPFAAVAALAGLTLPRREALLTVLALWIGNQAVGFLSIQMELGAVGIVLYPAPPAFLWGFHPMSSRIGFELGAKSRF